MIFSNCPDALLRNPRRATELAEKAVELEPQVSNNWTALGIARYREQSVAGSPHARLISPCNSEQMARVGHFAGRTPIDWFFLAMSNWQLGDKEEAHKCYDRAVEGMEKGQTWQTDVEQLRRFRAEAEELLKITDQKPTTKQASKRSEEKSGR